jgi:hypothetical protein
MKFFVVESAIAELLEKHTPLVGAMSGISLVQSV